MTTGMYKLHMAMLDLNRPVSMKEMMEAMGEGYVTSWEKMRKANKIIKTRSKKFVLNGTTLSAMLSLQNKIA